MGGIFISYRREDSTAYARLLSETLAVHFGDNQIFRDVDTLTPGVDFPQAIADAVGNCDVLLALIGPKWLTAERRGKRRLDDPGDYVRLEIAAALDRDTLVVPVLVENTPMPDRQELPEALGELADRNAHRLTDEGWDDGVRRLVSALKREVTPVAGGPNAPMSAAMPLTTTPRPTASPSPQSWGPTSTGSPPGAPWGSPVAARPGGGWPASPDSGSGRGRTAILAGAAAAVVAVVAVVAVLVFGGGGGSGKGSDTTLPFNPNDLFAETNVGISPSTGPVGTIVTLNGSGFLPNESIEIRFPVDVVAQTRADGEGRFSGLTFAVPEGAFSDQNDVSAIGTRSLRVGQAQFQVT